MWRSGRLRLAARLRRITGANSKNRSIFGVTPLGVVAHVGLDEEVVNAVDRGALVTSPLAADTLAFQATSALTAGRQFKRSVVWSRSKRVGRTESGWLVVAQMAAAAAIVVVVVVGRFRRTSVLLADVVASRCDVVRAIFVVIILLMVVMELVVVLRLRLASIRNFVVHVLRWLAVTAQFFLAEAPVVALVAQGNTSLNRAPK